MPENVFDKPSAEPNMFVLCRGEKSAKKEKAQPSNRSEIRSDPMDKHPISTALPPRIGKKSAKISWKVSTYYLLLLAESMFGG